MKIEINVPTSLSEITLEQYQKYLKIVEQNPDGNFLNAKIVEIFCGIPLSESYKLKISSVISIVDIINEVLIEKPKHIERFLMNGVNYGFIPDLDEMTLGEYIDLDNNISDWQKIHNAMNVLYRPIKNIKGDKYNLVDYTLVNSDKMKSMPMDAVVGSIFFFFNLGIVLSSHTIACSQEQKLQEIIQQNLTSEKNGDGINLFIPSPKEILQGLKISLN